MVLYLKRSKGVIITSEPITNEALNKYINDRLIKAEIFDTLESTNKTAKQRASHGAEEGLIIIAEEQSGGRGRLGRSFFSPRGSGIYFSILLRPADAEIDLTLITTATAVAVCKAIKAVYNIDAGIKWVNDIFVNGKKVGGILCETVFNGDKADSIIVGVGINIAPPHGGFPTELSSIAGALTNTFDSNAVCRFIAETVQEVLRLYRLLPTVAFLEEYKQHMLFIGKEISYQRNGRSFFGRILGIDESFALQVADNDGKVNALSFGEITIGSKAVTKSLNL